MEDIRWQQRFVHFRRAFELLGQAVAIEEPSDTERAGMIQFFEMTFELAWKMLKDYLEGQGLMVATPRETLKHAFQAGILANGHIWMEALKDRNLTSHTYEEKIARAIEKKIREAYYPMLQELFNWGQVSTFNNCQELRLDPNP